MGNMRFLYLLFLKRFKLKIIYRPRRMFWAGIFWTPPSLAVKEICTHSSRNLMKCNTWMNAVKSPFNSCSPTSNTEVIKRKAGFHIDIEMLGILVSFCVIFRRLCISNHKIFHISLLFFNIYRICRIVMSFIPDAANLSFFPLVCLTRGLSI